MPEDEADVVVIGGGQSGLAAARAIRRRGLSPVVLEAGTEPVGSWADYYDSLTAFSPVEYNSMPDRAFPGPPEHYPHRDEVVDYLRRYAAGLDVEIRTDTRVRAVEADGRGFVVRTSAGVDLRTAGVVAASGSFGHPYWPVIPGHDGFGGRLLHVADYRNPKPYVDQRVVVVGGGNSAVQIAYELAEVAEVTLADHRPIDFLPQVIDSHDVHYWQARSGFDDLPLEWLARIVSGTLVVDVGEYAAALRSGRIRERRMFIRFDGDRIVWPDGTAEPVDAVILATGYRPDLGYLEPLGALTDGLPLHTGGISSTHPGLVYVGLEKQRSFASNTLRGVHRDADHVAAPLAAYVTNAPVAVGIGPT